MARAGSPFEVIARRLGHRDVGALQAGHRERDRWEHIAAARDAEKWARDVATDATDAEKLHEESPATRYEREASDDSRGGTRTRDPGIMSAVL